MFRRSVNYTDPLKTLQTGHIQYDNLWQVFDLIVVQQKLFQCPGIPQHLVRHRTQVRITLVHVVHVTIAQEWHALKHDDDDDRYWLHQCLLQIIF